MTTRPTTITNTVLHAVIKFKISEFDKAQLLRADVSTCTMHLLYYSNFSYDWYGLSIRFFTINCTGILHINKFYKFNQWTNAERYVESI